MSVDINLTNVTVFAELTVYKVDTRKLYHIHHVYGLKRQRGSPKRIRGSAKGLIKTNF